MRKRGRVSAAETAVVIEGAFGSRPEPPDDLNERQSEIWRETIASEPPEFFNTATLRGMLSDYCRHRDVAEILSVLIDEFKPEWTESELGMDRYKKLLQMRFQETRAATSLATKLRLTNQSRYQPRTAAGLANREASNGNTKRPWEA